MKNLAQSMSADETIVDAGAYGKFFIALADDCSKTRVQGFKDEYGNLGPFEPVAWAVGRLGMTYILFAKTSKDGSDEPLDAKYFVYLEAPGAKLLQKYDIDEVPTYTLEQVLVGEWTCI